MNDDLPYIVVLAVMNIIEYILLNVLFSHYQKKGRKYSTVICVGIFFVSILTSVNMQRDLVKNISVSFMLMLITAMINFQGKSSKKFAFTVIYITMSAMAEVIITFIASIVAVIPLGATVESFTTYILSGLGGKFILFVIIKYLIKKYPKYYEMDKEQDILMLSLFPLAALVTTHVILDLDRRVGIPFHFHLLAVGLLVLFLF